MKLEDLWQETERQRLETRFAVAKELEILRYIPTRALRQIVLQYRYYTAAFADDLGFVVGRCLPSKLKSLLAEILHEELGCGDPARSHLAMYDRFLASIGCCGLARPGGAGAHPDVRELLGDLRRRTLEESPLFAVGLRGMGGECVCGVYFIEMYKHLQGHPLVVSRGAGIDWEFWDLHGGAADIEHDTRTRDAIRALLGDTPDPRDVEEIARGYRHGVAAWERFWRALYDDHIAAMARARTGNEARLAARRAVALSGTIAGRAFAMDVETQNISETGLLLSAPAPLAPGECAVLEVKEPGGPGITLQINIVRARRISPAAAELGVRVVDVLAGEARWLEITGAAPCA